MPGKVCEIRVGHEVFRFISEEDGLSLRGGPADPPDTFATLDPETLYALVVGRKTIQAVRRSIVIDGDQDFATELLTLLHGAVT